MDKKQPADTSNAGTGHTDGPLEEGRHADIVLMSEEVKDILGVTPRWIVRCGNMLMLLIVLLLIGLSGFIKVPEIIAGRVLVTPSVQPATATVPAATILRSLYVRDGDSVRAGQLLFNDLRSPVAGRLVFRRLLKIGDLLPASTPLLIILPWRREYIATVSMPSIGSGKVRLGQQVIVSMDDFPSSEFGNLTGTVASLPEYKDNIVSFSITLDHAAQTTYHKDLAILRPMEGTAEITTAEERLSRRIFSFLR